MTVVTLSLSLSPLMLPFLLLSLSHTVHNTRITISMQMQIYINHRQDILSIIGRLKRQSVDDLSLADVIFMTAHKSKGLQFDNVMIADDFLPVSGIHLPISGLLHNTSVLRMGKF